MKKFWERIKVGLWRFGVSTWYAWLGALLGVIAGLIWDQNVGMMIFFSVVGAFIGFVWLRQIWWFIWGSEKGDYPGREGWFKKLILLIFPKLRNEN